MYLAIMPRDETNHPCDPGRRAFLFGRRFSADETGATAIEYGVIGGLVGIALITSFSVLGGKIDRYFFCARRLVRFDGQKANTGRCFRAGPRDEELREQWRNQRREQRRRDRQKRREERRRRREEGGNG